MKSLVVIATAITLACTAAHSQIYKCVVNGSTTYQPTECSPGTGAALNGLQYHGGSAPPEVKPKEDKEPPKKEVVVAEKKQEEPVKPQKSDLEIKAEACLGWYKVFLKDPRSAYYDSPKMDKTVLSFELFSKNSYAAFVSKEAACEFKGSNLDDGWTRIQAKRRGWGKDLSIID